MTAQIHFLFSVIGLILAVNTRWSVRDKRWPVINYIPTFFSFLAGWLTSELALHLLVALALIQAVFISQGTLASGWGISAVAFATLSAAFLLASHQRSRLTQGLVAQALESTFATDEEYIAQSQGVSGHVPPWNRLLLPFLIRQRSVIREKNIPYHTEGSLRLRLDVYHSKEQGARRPILLYVHGGGWVMGSKNDQGLPIMNHMAGRGWVCVNADYRLVRGRHKYPDPIVDLKRAIRWIHKNIHNYGGDPNYIAIAGGSAGGHLASLVATSSNDAQFQPGFEDEDTSISACIALYGIYDLANSNAVWNPRTLPRLVERFLMERRLKDDPEAFRQASAFHRIHKDTPPFMVVHGTNDSLVPVDEARYFAAKLQEVSTNASCYLELPGAQHAFEIFPSLRTEWLMGGIETFLKTCYQKDRSKGLKKKSTHEVQTKADGPREEQY